jgi:hypothetical protein
MRSRQKKQSLHPPIIIIIIIVVVVVIEGKAGLRQSQPITITSYYLPPIAHSTLPPPPITHHPLSIT